MKPSTEYPATVVGVKRGLKAIEWSRNRAAEAIEKSPAMVSMVLARKAKSQPILDALAALIKSELTRQSQAVKAS